MRSSIAAKIIAIVAVTIVVFSAALVAAWLALGSVTSRTQRDGKLSAAAHAAAAAAYNMRLSEAQSVASQTRLKGPGGGDMHASDVAAYRHAMARLRAQAPAGLGAVDRLFAAWQSTDAQVLRLVDAGNYTAAAALVAGQANSRGDALAGSLTHVGERATQQATLSSASARRSAELLMLGIAVLALLVAAGATTFVARRLRRDTDAVLDRLHMLREHCVTDLRDGLEQLSTGDLTRTLVPVTPPITVKSSDEIGRIAHEVNRIRERTIASIGAYNEMRAGLSTLITDVSDSARALTESSQQVASTSEETGRAVNQIADAITEVAEGATRQAAMVEEANATTAETSAAAAQARGIAIQGATAAAEASETMTRVNESSLQVTTAIRELAEKSSEIGGIVLTITTIADQTNLLALNAAIEAARAGEQGRGFAVVADEVRKLAEESRQAVAKIADLVDEIQAETQRVVGAVEQAAERTEQGAATVERARAAFAEIGTAVTAVTSRIGDIAGVTDQVASLAEQNSGSSQLAAASTQQTSASTEELAASAQELAATAETLSRLVSRFTTANV